MPKTSSPRRARRPSRRRTRASASVRERVVDVISQLECAVRQPQAAILGGLLGGAVPWFARTLAHGEIPEAWHGNRTAAWLMIAVVLGCAAFSMLTVYKFGLAAFGDARKAVGFVLALEGVMLVSRGTTSVVALLLLVAINAIANGCVMALAREATGRRQEADARRSATRARNRARARGDAPAPATAVSTTPAAESPASAPRPTAIPVVRAPAAARAPRRGAGSPGLAHRPRWMPEVVEDAEFTAEVYS